MNKNENLTIEETFNLAVKNHQENKTDIAQGLYNQVLKINPKHSAALNNLGVIFKDLGEIQKAKACYEKAITINPNYADAYNNFGVIFKDLGENEKAKTCYEKAITINPNYANAYQNLGIIFQALGENEKAKACYEKVIKIDPKYVEAYSNLGVIFNILREYQNAINCYNKAITIKPNYVNAHNNLGTALENFGKFDEAEASYKKAIELKPNYEIAHNNLGNILKELGRFDEAEVSYKKAINLKPNYVVAHNNLDILLKKKTLLSKIEQTKSSNNKTKISFFKKDSSKLFVSNLRLTSNPFISNRKVEAELTDQLYKINSKKLDDVDPGYLRYGNGRSSDYKLFENNFSIIETVAKDLTIIMKNAVKSDIFIVESFFNIFQRGSGIVFHNHVDSFDYNFGLSNQKFSLTYYLDIGDQNCNEPGILKLQDPDTEILPLEGMIVIFPASRKHSATYSGKKDRVMIGVNFYSLNT